MVGGDESQTGAEQQVDHGSHLLLGWLLFLCWFFSPPLYSFYTIKLWRLSEVSLLLRASCSAGETHRPPPAPLSQQKVIQTGQMDREARRIGRSLVRNEDEFEDDDDYDDDLMDLEASNVVLTPLLRSDLLLGLLLNPGSSTL